MRLLLDTHALLWWWLDDPRLSRRAHAAIGDEDNEILVSAASAWEISTKARIGKFGDLPDATRRFSELLAADGFLSLPVTHAHALKAGSWESDHRDPFDRMLAAQSRLEGLPLVTADPALAAYEGKRFW